MEPWLSNVESYLGLWYQMYADSFVTNSFEKNAYCDTATYTMRRWQDRREELRQAGRA